MIQVGDPRRQSQKSLKNLSQVNNDSHLNYFEHHQNHHQSMVGGPMDVLTSEETSDTNIEDHLEGGGRYVFTINVYAFGLVWYFHLAMYHFIHIHFTFL